MQVIVDYKSPHGREEICLLWGPTVRDKLQARVAGGLVTYRVVAVRSLSCVLLFWTVASQAPLSMGFPRQEYWRGLPFPSPGDFPGSAIEPMSPALAG